MDVDSFRVMTRPCAWQVDQADGNHCTPLAVACERVRHRSGCVIRLGDANVIPSLCHAVSCRQSERRIVELLLEHGANPTACSSRNPTQTPLLIAVRQASAHIVETLFEGSRRRSSPLP